MGGAPCFQIPYSIKHYHELQTIQGTVY
jgi:hypothetical protein